MSDIKISKLEAARKQVSSSIKLLLSDEDPVSAHTLAGAASVLLHDLVEKKEPNSSIETIASSELGVALKEMLNKWREPQNFLKHADRDHDPKSTIEFDVRDTDKLLTAAIVNILILTGEVNKKELAFAHWSFATSPVASDYDKESKTLDEAKDIFPNIINKPRSEQLQMGKKYLEQFY